MHFIKINQDYIDFMRQNDSRIPNQDYGEGKYKPFYILHSLSGEDVLYVTQLTSPKERHEKMSDNLDFKKIFDPKTGRLLGATNLNYMFPVLPEYIDHLSMSDIKNILKDNRKVYKLVTEKKELNKMDLVGDFKRLYNLKYRKPDSSISKRCLDFKSLEANMLEFKLQEQFERNDIKVERSDDYSTFLIHTNADTYEYSDSILEDMYGFLIDMNDNLAYENGINDLSANNYLDI